MVRLSGLVRTVRGPVLQRRRRLPVRRLLLRSRRLPPLTPAYVSGVPCWVETLQPDPRAATTFYHELFGWDFEGPGPMPDGGEYFVARSDGLDVAGVATLPPSGIAEPAWTTFVFVDGVDEASRRAEAAGGRIVVPPLDALPAGRLAIVEDPTGATFGLWQAQERTGAQRVNAPSAWAMSALRMNDVDSAVAFYESLFGWTTQPFQAGPAPAVLFRRAGYAGGTPEQPVPRDVVAVAMELAEAETAHWSVDFWIDDADAAVRRIEELGGAVIVAPFDAPPFRRAVVADPAGAIFTLSHLTGPPPRSP